MRRSGLFTGLLVALCASPSLQAALCTQDAVPAATLLYPYFEVDAACAATPATNTEFTVTNSHHEPIVSRVTLWTNSGVPGLTFDVYLNGYDQQTIDLDRVFCDGFLPSTGSAVEVRGRLSANAIAYPGCNATATPPAAPVYGGDGAISPSAAIELRARFSGQPLPSSATQCMSRPNGRSTIDGYITIDVVDRCSATPIGTAGFNTHLTAKNVLIGSALHYSHSDNSSFSLPAVPIEATSGTQLDVSASFYAQAGLPSGPRREPLPVAWSTEQGGGGLPAARAEHIVWRAPPAVGTAFACATGPSWFPLPLGNKTGFGSRGVFHVRDDGSALRTGRLAPVPLMAQRVIATTEFPELALNPFAAGWTYFNLARPDTATDFPAQAWVATVRRAPGAYALLHEGIPNGDACSAPAFNNPSTGPLLDQAGPP